MKHWLFAGAGLVALLGFFGVVHGQPSSSASASASGSGGRRNVMYWQAPSG